MITLYPTETVYGLGVDVFDDAALERLYTLKGRDQSKAVTWLVRDVGEIERYAQMDELAAKIAKQFLPGPLTLVLPVRDTVPVGRAAPDNTIGFRISADPIAQRLAAEYEHPLTCTSANVSGMEPQASVPDILAQFGERAELIERILDGGPRSGPPSTVVRVSNGILEILRVGAIPADTIEEML